MAVKGLWQKEIRAGRYKFAAGFVVLAAVALFITLSYDYTLKMLDSAPLPQYARDQVDQFKDYQFYIWSQWFGKNLFQMSAGIALIFGSGIFTSEVTRKTIQFILAKPISRKDIFTVKYVVNFLALVMAVLTSTALLYGSVLATGHTIPATDTLAYTLMAIAGMSVVFSIAVYFSTVFDRTIKAFLVSAVAVIALSAPGIIESRLSLYYHMTGASMFEGKGLPLLPLAIAVIVSSGLYLLGRARFVTKDF